MAVTRSQDKAHASKVKVERTPGPKANTTAAKKKACKRTSRSKTKRVDLSAIIKRKKMSLGEKIRMAGLLKDAESAVQVATALVEAVNIAMNMPSQGKARSALMDVWSRIHRLGEVQDGTIGSWGLALEYVGYM